MPLNYCHLMIIMFRKKMGVSKDIKKELIEIIKIRIPQKTIKIRYGFKMTCFNLDGIDAIKESISKGQKMESKKVVLKFRIIASPLYECIAYTTNKNDGMKIMNAALIEIQNTIINKGGNFELQINPLFMEENGIIFNGLMKKLNENEWNGK